MSAFAQNVEQDMNKSQEKDNTTEVEPQEDDKNWEERVITPLNGVPPMSFWNNLRPQQELKPYDECDATDELQFYLEM